MDMAFRERSRCLIVTNSQLLMSRRNFAIMNWGMKQLGCSSHNVLQFLQVAVQ